MTFYIVSFAAKVDQAELPIAEDADGRRAVKELNIWDERDHVELGWAYANALLFGS